MITDVDRAFRECLRVLRPGGHLLVFDYQKAVGEQLASSDPERHRRAWDAAELCERIRTAGFVDVRFGTAVDVFSGSAHESDAKEFGTRGFAIFGRRP